jgi:hypothetical protein
MLTLTYHAQARLQQRGIPALVIESLLDYGRKEYDHRGGRVIYFDHRARKRLQRAFDSQAYKFMERHLDTYAVVALDGEIVTVGHRCRRINRH